MINPGTGLARMVDSMGFHNLGRVRDYANVRSKR
jgi:hypothetical protein